MQKSEAPVHKGTDRLRPKILKCRAPLHTYSAFYLRQRPRARCVPAGKAAPPRKSPRKRAFCSSATARIRRRSTRRLRRASGSSRFSQASLRVSYAQTQKRSNQSPPRRSPGRFPTAVKNILSGSTKTQSGRTARKSPPMTLYSHGAGRCFRKSAANILRFSRP